MSVHWGGDGMAELGEPSIAAAIKARLARDQRPEESADEALAMFQRWLASRGKATADTPEKLRLALVATEQVLRALDVRPSIPRGGRTQIPPAHAGPAGPEEEGSNP